MNIFAIVTFVAGLGFGIAATVFATSSSDATTIATAPALTQTAIATAISKDPSLCPAPKSGLVVPSNDEATLAFRTRQDAQPGLKTVLKLGDCQKGAVTAVQCGADIDWNGKGTNVTQRTVGFTKTPTGWMAVLY